MNKLTAIFVKITTIRFIKQGNAGQIALLGGGGGRSCRK